MKIGATGLNRHQNGPWCYTLRIKHLALAHGLAELENNWQWPDKDYHELRRLLRVNAVVIRLPTVCVSGWQGKSAKLYLVPWAPKELVLFMDRFLKLRALPPESAHEKAELVLAELTFSHDLAVRAKAYRDTHPDFAALRVLFQ